MANAERIRLELNKYEDVPPKMVQKNIMDE